MSWLLWGETAVEPIKPIIKKCISEDHPGIVELSKLLEYFKHGTSKMLAAIKSGPRALAWKTRFLTAAGGDPKLAVQKIKEMLDERDAVDLDNYRNWKVERIRRASASFPFNIFYGLTKQHVPLSISIMGTSDIYQAQKEVLAAYPKKLLETRDHGELILEWLKKGYLHQLEHLTQIISVEASKKAGREIFDCVAIVDMKDFSLAQVAFPLWVTSFISFICNCENVLYPGMNGQSFVVNCNTYFTTAWKIISNFLPQAIIDNIQILGEDWQEHLKDILDIGSLPPVLGGKGPKLFEHPSYLGWVSSTRDPQAENAKCEAEKSLEQKENRDLKNANS